MRRRGRVIAVLGVVLGGAIILLSATQPWLVVERTGGVTAAEVTGGDAIVLIAPLGVTALVLGGALAIVGRVVRRVVGVIGVLTGGALASLCVELLMSDKIAAITSTVTELTGLAGETAVRASVAFVSATAWPYVALFGAILITASALSAVLFAHRWGRGGRKYRTDLIGKDEPTDAFATWDSLSQGTDPTSPAR